MFTTTVNKLNLTTSFGKMASEVFFMFIHNKVQ